MSSITTSMGFLGSFCITLCLHLVQNEIFVHQSGLGPRGLRFEESMWKYLIFVAFNWVIYQLEAQVYRDKWEAHDCEIFVR